MNQGDKSRIRIQIESLLIDLNEEVFITSEVLASAFSSTKPKTHELVMKAHSIEQRKEYLFGKVKQCITSHPIVAKLQTHGLSVAATHNCQSIAESGGIQSQLSP